MLSACYELYRSMDKGLEGLKQDESFPFEPLSNLLPDARSASTLTRPLAKLCRLCLLHTWLPTIQPFLPADTGTSSCSDICLLRVIRHKQWAEHGLLRQLCFYNQLHFLAVCDLRVEILSESCSYERVIILPCSPGLSYMSKRYRLAADLC